MSYRKASDLQKYPDEVEKKFTNPEDLFRRKRWDLLEQIGGID